MATEAASARAIRWPWLPAAAGLSALMVVSALARTRRLEVGFWIDEALSVGIADRPLGEIPGTLRLDGSPPLYYLLLHAWMRVAGDGEAATHALSLVAATLTIPVAWVLMRSLFGERTAWVAAALAATNPFLTQYAQETRMYSLAVLLGTVACATFLGAFAFGRGRRWTLGFAVSLAALLYTHNWALFFAAACGLVWLALCAARANRHSLVREGLWGFGLALALFSPWLPSLLFQAAHTGAPWASAPALGQLTAVPVRLLDDVPAAVLAIVAGTGIATLLRRPLGPAGRAVGALGAIAAGTAAIAWIASQLSPAWASRYLAVAVPPLLMLCAAGLARAGRPAWPALLLVVTLWAVDPGPRAKSNVRELAAELDPALAPGDLVISTQPEQLPAVAYYLETPGLRWATLTGPVSDVGVTDWRDGPERLAATSPERDLAPLLDALEPGARVALVEPQISDLRRWDAPWTRLVRLRSAEWSAEMTRDPRFRVVAVRPVTQVPAGPNPLKATVFTRRAMR